MKQIGAFTLWRPLRIDLTIIDEFEGYFPLKETIMKCSFGPFHFQYLGKEQKLTFEAGFRPEIGQIVTPSWVTAYFRAVTY